MSKSIEIISKNDVEKICKEMTTSMGNFVIEQFNKLKKEVNKLEEEVKILRLAVLK